MKSILFKEYICYAIEIPRGAITGPVGLNLTFHCVKSNKNMPLRSNFQLPFGR
jgi:hypothetical protein